MRALVLSACTPRLSDRARAWLRNQTPAYYFGHRDPVRGAEFEREHTAAGPGGWRTVLAALNALSVRADAEEFPETEALRGIGAPALVLHGDRDFFTPVELAVELYRLLPDAELCVLPKGGHGLEKEHPDRFSAIVLDFLARRAT